MPSSGLSIYIETRLFFKKKRGLELELEVWNYFSCYILLNDQVSLSGCPYFVRYWAICLLQLFANQVVTS